MSDMYIHVLYSYSSTGQNQDLYKTRISFLVNPRPTDIHMSGFLPSATLYMYISREHNYMYHVHV